LVVGLHWDLPVGRHPTRYSVSRTARCWARPQKTNFVDTTVAASTAYDYAVSAARGPGERFSVGTVQVRHARRFADRGRSVLQEPSHRLDQLGLGRRSYRANGSDLWPVTWGKDGNVYTFFGDGGGFGGDNQRGRVSSALR